MKKRLVSALVLAFVLTLGGAAVATATTPNDLQSQVNEVLAQYPGGEQIGPGEISWNDGAMILTLEGATAHSGVIGAMAAVGSCASGAFCAYNGTNLSGAKLTFTNCAALNIVSPLGSPVRSVANARSSGNVHGYNGSAITLTVGAQSWANTTATIQRLGC